jgi:hypothetical protein
MKLRPLTKNKEIWLKEFDHWVTPFLEEIRDTDIFHKTLANIKEAIELLGEENKKFTTDDAASATHIADAVMRGIKNKPSEKEYSIVSAFCDLLFLVTGKTDNNYKCQFPVYVKEILKWKDYPAVKAGKLSFVSVPRVIKSENIAGLIVQLEYLKTQFDNGTLEHLKTIDAINSAEHKILLHYFEFILNKEIYLRSLKVFGAKYFELKKLSCEDDLLAPIIISFVRGSASATGGHKPEQILRQHMNSWGLRPNEDYNVQDVKPFEVEASKNDKTRAYDFVLPFNVKDWDKTIFIQSQFYAGDSGSVSHKNVDQTITSRQKVKALFEEPKFVEYVDGAGYYGALNGDLKKLLYMADTDNFFQVRTSPIKLRQLLQEIKFITPLELVHALAINNFNLANAQLSLRKDGYGKREILRIIQKATTEGIISLSKGNAEVKVEDTFYELSRRYFLLDCIVIFGSELEEYQSGYVFIPGYEEYYGAKASQLIKNVKTIAGRYYKDWKSPEVFMADLEFLLHKKWIIFEN